MGSVASAGSIAGSIAGSAANNVGSSVGNAANTECTSGYDAIHNTEDAGNNVGSTVGAVHYVSIPSLRIGFSWLSNYFSAARRSCCHLFLTKNRAKTKEVSSSVLAGTMRTGSMAVDSLGLLPLTGHVFGHAPRL